MSFLSFFSFYRKSGAILDPCLPLELTETVNFRGKAFTLKGTGDFLQCKNDIYPLLNKTAPCSKPNCSFNSVHQSNIDFHHSEFYGFSEYWYSMHDVLRIGGKYSTLEFEKAAKVSLLAFASTVQAALRVGVLRLSSSVQIVSQFWDLPQNSNCLVFS